MLKAFLSVLFAFGLSAAFANDVAAMQPRQSYEAAFRNNSTSPSYVRISVIDGETGQGRSVCTTANFVLGAIHREYGLGYGAADLAKALEIALKSEDRSFRFHQPAALANIPSRYSEADLAAARAFLAPYSTSELKAKFSTLLAGARLDTKGYARDAIACVLIERGLSPKMADIAGIVYVTSEFD
jgi:hypothetical protein